MTFEEHEKNFYKCLDEGKMGEIMAARLLERLNFDIEDVRDDAAWRARDVDFIGTKRGKTIRFEVKTNSNIKAYNSMCFESLIHRPKGTVDGWLEYSEADVFIFCDSSCGDIYFIKNDTHKIKVWGNKSVHMNYAEGNRDELIILKVDQAREHGLLKAKFNYYDFCMPDDELF